MSFILHKRKKEQLEDTCILLWLSHINESQELVPLWIPAFDGLVQDFRLAFQNTWQYPFVGRLLCRDYKNYQIRNPPKKYTKIYAKITVTIPEKKKS